MTCSCVTGSGAPSSRPAVPEGATAPASVVVIAASLCVVELGTELKTYPWRVYGNEFRGVEDPWQCPRAEHCA
ncbi:hypothetical protein GCM10010510_36000 [Streptomyces anandii JCM 4720]|nr:hypothetical protein GCM10010510_36000 [Streptomyces anandii JCM 4720]